MEVVLVAELRLAGVQTKKHKIGKKGKILIFPFFCFTAISYFLKKYFLMIKHTIFITLLLITSSVFAQWEQLNGPIGGYVRSIIYDGENIYAATGGGPLQFVKGGLFAGSGEEGAFISTNARSTWSEVNNGLNDTNILSMCSDGTNVYAGTSSEGIFKTINLGANWVESNT